MCIEVAKSVKHFMHVYQRIERGKKKKGGERRRKKKKNRMKQSKRVSWATNAIVMRGTPKSMYNI